MEAKFEVKYLDVKWYDKDTVLSVKESFIPLKTEFDAESQYFKCNTVIYPKVDGIKNGRMGFRFLFKNVSSPYLEAVDGTRIPLKLIIDNESGKEWWIEADTWIPETKMWGSKTIRTAGKMMVVLQHQICQVNIGSVDFTVDQLERYLFDFKSDLWELILDENSYVTGKVKKMQDGGVSEAGIHLIAKLLTHAQKILENPKSELREIQTLKPWKMVKPVTRTFMELTTKGESRFLTSRATKPSYNVPENRYILFALERIYKILKQLVNIFRSRVNRFDAAIEKLQVRYESFSDVKLIDKDLVRRDLERLRSLYKLDDLNQAIERKLGQLSLPSEKLKTWYLRVGNKSSHEQFAYSVSIKSDDDIDWVESKPYERKIFLSFKDDRFKSLFEKNIEYELDAEINITKEEVISTDPPPYDFSISQYNYVIVNLNRLKITGGISLKNRQRKFSEEKEKAMKHNSEGWIKKLSLQELSEQTKEKSSIQTRLKHVEEQCRTTKLAFDLLEPKLAKFKTILMDLKALGVRPSATFPNSMTFVQNPNYQAVHAGYKNLREITNLSDEDLLLSLERIDEIGLINMPLLYERWCLLQIIKVLIQQFRYFPDQDWKRKLLAIVSNGTRNQCLHFTNDYVKRSIQLWYEPKISNGRTPDFVMDVKFEQKMLDSPKQISKFNDDSFGVDSVSNGGNDESRKQTKRFVMDAKFYSLDLLQNIGGIASVIHQLYHEKDYSEGGKNAVFVLHPAVNAISEKVSPQSWGKDSYLGELEMFSWDKQLRQTHYHQYGAICANPINRANYLDEFQRLIGMFLQYGIENNELENNEDDDVRSINFCLACGSHDVTKLPKSNFNERSKWYVCNECKHFTTYNHCYICNTRLIKNGDYWTYHSQMPMEPLNIKCPACESLV
ncbi:EstP [Undibacterium macrobrachii]|uniref:EstP n=1 Tax=Undibacterium macrobrachii TaxID=1119058 RepID=A0ABQ2XHV5_9BURK|nr:EstP [Undibacterium macrobrachii]GGX17153.1 hypothetical protein GCM10011282_23990 [Undibacterium macrobrachii]